MYVFVYEFFAFGEFVIKLLKLFTIVVAVLSFFNM